MAFTITRFESNRALIGSSQTRDRKHDITSLKDLKQKIIKIWHNIPTKTCNKPINTINNCVNFVLKAKLNIIRIELI